MTPPQKLKPALLPLPYLRNSDTYFRCIFTQLGKPVLLQSDASEKRPLGRFDILSAAPEYHVETRDGGICYYGSLPTLPDCTDSFALLSELIVDMEKQPVDYSECIEQELPFCGGLIGYCGYDLAREYISLPSTAYNDLNVPSMQFAFYGWACIQDHLKQHSWLVLHPMCSETLRTTLPAIFKSATGKKIAGADITTDDRRSDTTRQKYGENFKRIQSYIRSGDCYQINLSQRFSMHCTNSAQDIYWHLRETMPSPFCAFVPIGNNGAILSFSPERFLKMDVEKNIQTQPIKGTIARSNTPIDDAVLAESLLNDPKSRSENIMIVDLLRNDLGRVCETGSVVAERLCELQSFSNVHHLVSTISGKLKNGLNGADLFKACFPGGSITGAPKYRAMQIIEELEKHRRSIYCGAIVYFSAHGAMDSNIMIRSLLLHENRLYCWGGGGIVADSEADTEYEETLTKINVLLGALRH